MVRVLTQSLLSITIAIAFSRVASAHGGHGVDPRGESLEHYVLEPVHLIPALAVISTALIITWFAVRRLRRSTQSIARR
jgi:uncharacterized membrane-anchored protein